MLRPSSDVAETLQQTNIKPYVDPAFNNPHVYSKFLLQLSARGLVEWQVGGESFLGLFLVLKNCMLRMILDTRKANKYFADPQRADRPPLARLAWLRLSEATKPILVVAT